MKIIIYFITAILFFSEAFCLENKPLKLDEVLKSATNNYPKILALYEEVEAAKGSVLANQGFFDVKLRASYLDNSRGFYDGKQLNTEIVKQNQFLNSEIYGGYRKSFDNFATYDGDLQTNNDGEFRIGAKFSLLQNSMIDENRLKLRLAKLGVEESKIALENIKNEIKRDATKAYYSWVVAGKIHEIQKNLYELALKRNEQLKILVKKGDLASITLTENEMNALNRKSSMIKALQDFENNAVYLSLFYRDENSDPILAKKDQLPKLDFNGNLKELQDKKFNQDLNFALQNRADIRLIRIANQKESQNLLQAKNLYKPKLDVDFSASNDISNENQARGQSKNEVNVKFELPLQQRVAKGQISKSKAKIERIKYEKKLLEESAKIRLEQSKIAIDNISKMHANLKEEVKLAKKLENAERNRFKQGGSDFFLINLREQNTARAQIASALVFGDYFKNLAQYEAEVFLP
jgi:outer membrane protein TolC